MQNDRGFSLIEVMAGLTLFAWMALLTVNMGQPYRAKVEQNQQRAAQLEAVADLVDLVSNAAVELRSAPAGTAGRLILADTYQCSWILQGPPAVSVEGITRWRRVRLEVIQLATAEPVWVGERILEIR